jgi:hypothetical protein
LAVTAPTGVQPVTRIAYITTGCLVPNFAGRGTDEALAMWTSANFSGTITYSKTNGNGTVQSSSTTPPSPSHKISDQTPLGGANAPSGSTVTITVGKYVGGPVP